ncbi:MAG TPA: M23 family metallopeptidase, partial [Microbacterium sp.]|nr:M23 family metallopeptidase [Microbacterium sp.]
TACSASSPSEQSGRPTPATTGGQTSLVDVNAEERFSALVIRPTEPETIPVMGTDGRFHVVYELEVQNTSPRPATITEVLTLDPENDVVSSLEGDAVMALSMIVADFALPPVPADLVPAGRSVLLIMDAVFDQDNEIPSSLIHAVTATFGGFEPNQGDFALNNFPDESTETGGLVTVGDGEPEVIGPPMTGGGWVAVNGCCELSPHRGAMLPLGGRINGSERYAVDWSRFDTDAEPLVDFEMGTQATFSGDPDDNNSYFTFGEPAIAVADAEVIAVVDGLEDAPPHVFLTLPLKDLGGNRVILKLRDGVYAFYGHLKKGSVLVEVGDTVERGDQIAELGNSGNTSEAHLHFHLMNGPLPLTATNLPWVIDSFVFEGTAEPAGLIATGTGERENELPLMYSTVGFDD